MKSSEPRDADFQPGTRSREWNRAESRKHRQHRRELIARGLPARRTQHIYYVKTDQINIPEWASRYALEGFTREADVIWVKQRGVAKQIAREDGGCGGKPQIEKVVARRCSICRMWVVGLLADDRKMVEERYTGKVEPCSSTCLAVARARKTLPPEFLAATMAG